MTSKILRADQTPLAGIRSVTYREQVNGDVDLRPGCVASAYIEVEAAGGQSDAPTAGEALTYYQVDGNGNETLIGVFYAEPSVPTRNTFRFTAYDAVSKLDADYSARLAAIQNNFPMSIYALVSDACSVAGVTLGSSSWPLSTQTVQAFYADGLTCRNILQYAAELACRFVRCDTAGRVVFGWYTAAANLRIYPSGGTSGSETRIPYKQGGLDYENYDTAALDRAAVHPTGTDDAAYIYPANVSSGNTLHIRNNLLLTGAEAAFYNAAAQNIYTELSALGPYRPMTAKLFPGANPFRAGQIVPVTDVQGVSFTAAVMSMTVAPDAATLVSTGNRTLSEAAGDVGKAIAQLASDIVRINKLKVDWAEIGAAVIDTLEAEGISADWINAGALTVKDANGNVIFSADVATKSVQLGGFGAYKKGTAVDWNGIIGDSEIICYSEGGKGIFISKTGIEFGYDVSLGTPTTLSDYGGIHGGFISWKEPDGAIMGYDGLIIGEYVKIPKLIVAGQYVSDYIKDSGWNTLTLTSDFALYSANAPVKYRKVGQLVEVRGVVKPTASLAGSNTAVTIGTLPAGYRPDVTRYFICQGSGQNKWLLSIGTNGALGFARYGITSMESAGTSVWLPFDAVFFAG